MRVPTGQSPRQGIGLLEVLISIGVVALGLLGVIALIPLAQHRAIQGAVNDRAALVGRRAFREFRIRGMDRPRTWFERQPGDVIDPTSGQLLRRAWLLDPLGYAAYAGQDAQTVFPADPNCPVVNRLQRVTLRAGVLTGSAAVAMTSQQADRIFVCGDDLGFEIPEGDDLPTPLQQIWVADGTGTAVVTVPGPQQVPLRRYNEGRFSWCATLVPELGRDKYTLSIVVFHRRVLDSTVELSAEVQSLSAGELRLSLPNVEAAHQAIKKDSWILLTQRQQVSGTTPELLARWYRVVQTDADVDEAASTSSQVVTRTLTVSGPEWPGAFTTGNRFPWRAILVPDVIAVYEKTIHLDSSSLWPDVARVPAAG